MTPRGTLGLCCIHIAQLVTHPAVYTLSFTLQLCYKPLGILERLIKSQKFHCKNFTTLTLLDIGPKVFSERKVEFSGELKFKTRKKKTS